MSGFDFALKGTKERRIYSSYSRKALEIKGGFHISGPQPINDEGGAPVWVAEKFDELLILIRLLFQAKREVLCGLV